jgi:predicted MFS family arabinose efflux permease
MIIVSNQLDIANMTTNWFQFTSPGGISVTNYTLLQNANGLAQSFSSGATNFANIAGSNMDGYLFLQGNDVMLQVVPEPSAYILVAIGILGLMVLLRKRGSSVET